MKLIFLTNNEVSNGLIHWLVTVAKEEVFVCGERLTIEIIEKTRPSFLISYNYRYIIKDNILNIFQNRAINLHISFLPWNRGADPNVWSLLENTPKGVTIHLIDSGIDTGAILLQEEVHIEEEKETLESSYAILNEEIQKLFIAHWDAIKNQSITPKEQPHGGNIHSKKDFNKIRNVLDEKGWDISILELKRRHSEIKKEIVESK